MSLKSLLMQAKANQATHARKTEIESLDLNPEEYLFVRDDKNAMGLELLNSILEKIPSSGWEIDPSTMRFVRNSDTDGERSFRKPTASIVITSNTKRFFVKAFRDYPQLNDLDLIKCASITDAIICIDAEIEEIERTKIIEIERRRQEELLAEQRRVDEAKRIHDEEIAAINQAVQDIGTQLAIIDEMEIQTVSAAEAQLNILKSDIQRYCEGLTKEEVILYIDQPESPATEYEIIDDVPCRTIMDERQFLATLVSTDNIFHCLKFENLMQESKNSCNFDIESRMLVIGCALSNIPTIAQALEHIGIAASRPNAVYVKLHKEERLSEQLVRAKTAIQNSMQHLATRRRSIRIMERTFVDQSNKEIFLTIKADIDTLAENVAAIVWDNRQGRT